MPDHSYLPFLEKILTPGRLAHSLGVMSMMGELGEVYGLDQEIAQTIGILHDAAKDLSEDEIAVLVEEGDIQINYDCETNYVLYLHGPVGAFFIQKELGIQDELILGAITGHTYYGNGKYFHHPMSWCLRFSDILEPNRNWTEEKIIFDCVARLRELAFSGRLKEGALLQTGCLIEWFDGKGIPVHPTMRKIYREFRTELNIADD